MLSNIFSEDTLVTLGLRSKEQRQPYLDGLEAILKNSVKVSHVNNI